MRGEERRGPECLLYFGRETEPSPPPQPLAHATRASLVSGEGILVRPIEGIGWT
jgi:hypothetical protein